MADFIGSRPRKKGSGGIFMLLILLVALGGGALYLYFNYVWPAHVQHKEFARVAAYEMRVSEGCKTDDTACKERLTAASREMAENEFARLSSRILAMPAVKERLLKAHKDGSICFLASRAAQKDPSDDELKTWLDAYGLEKFLEDTALIARAKKLYEGRYHKPDPFMAQHEFVRGLRWKQFPFGAAWRDCTLAAQYMEWMALTKNPTAPAQAPSAESAMMEALQKNPQYFTDKNVARLTAMAKSSLTVSLLAKVRDALRRFRADMREYPPGEDDTHLNLAWLSSREGMPPWLKGRWYGPYIDAELLYDLWRCPIVAARVPVTGELMLMAYGADCAKGGEGDGKDISLVLMAGTTKSETPQDEERAAQEPPVEAAPAIEAQKKEPATVPVQKKSRMRRERTPPDLGLNTFNPRMFGLGEPTSKSLTLR